MTTTEYAFHFDVHIFDTDCYGVMWHGSYHKWLEMGRVNFFKEMGLNIKDLSDHHGIVFPVTEQRIRYKRPAKHDDKLRLTTKVLIQEPKFIFVQDVRNIDTNKVTIEAETDVVLLDGNKGRMLRKFPDIVKDHLPNTVD